MQIQFIRHLLPCKDKRNIRLHAKHSANPAVQSLHPYSILQVVQGYKKTSSFTTLVTTSRGSQI